MPKRNVDYPGFFSLRKMIPSKGKNPLKRPLKRLKICRTYHALSIYPCTYKLGVKTDGTHGQYKISHTGIGSSRAQRYVLYSGTQERLKIPQRWFDSAILWLSFLGLAKKNTAEAQRPRHGAQHKPSGQASCQGGREGHNLLPRRGHKSLLHLPNYGMRKGRG